LSLCSSTATQVNPVLFFDWQKYDDGGCRNTNECVCYSNAGTQVSYKLSMIFENFDENNNA